MGSDENKKVKAELELKLSRDGKNNKGFYRYTSQKGKTNESVSPLINKMGGQVTTDMEEAGALINVSALAFSSHYSSHTTYASHVPKSSRPRNEVPPIVSEGWVLDYLMKTPALHQVHSVME